MARAGTRSGIPVFCSRTPVITEPTCNRRRLITPAHTGHAVPAAASLESLNTPTASSSTSPSPSSASSGASCISRSFADDAYLNMTQTLPPDMSSSSLDKSSIDTILNKMFIIENTIHKGVNLSRQETYNKTCSTQKPSEMNVTTPTSTFARHQPNSSTPKRGGGGGGGGGEGEEGREEEGGRQDTPSAENLGRRVAIGGRDAGVLRYVGPVHFDAGTWCGVELDADDGRHDGLVMGHRYFSCPARRGLLAPLVKVKLLPVPELVSPTATCSDTTFPPSLADGEDPPVPSSRKRRGTYVLSKSPESLSLLGRLGSNRGDVGTTEHDAVIATAVTVIPSALPFSSSPVVSSVASTIPASIASPFMPIDTSPGCLPVAPFTVTSGSSFVPSSSIQTVATSTATPSKSVPVPAPPRPRDVTLREQSSLEMDESLGILTPDQMTDLTDYSDSFTEPGEFLVAGVMDGTEEKRIPMLDDSLLQSSTQCPPMGLPSTPVSSAARWVQLQSMVGNRLLDQESFPELESLPWHEHALTEDSPVAASKCARQELMNMAAVQRCDWSVAGMEVPATTKASPEGSPSIGDTPRIRPRQEVSGCTLHLNELHIDLSASSSTTITSTPPSWLPLNLCHGLPDTHNKTEQENDLTLDETLEGNQDATTGAGSPAARPASSPRFSRANAPLPPSSFVTSVTSITSLDTGYQGDGEWSRPGSRGADRSPTGMSTALHAPLSTALLPDPMTDSDFFTESDADLHEDTFPLPTEAATRRGDRRAQVIDGTLYGVAGSSTRTHPNLRCPSFTTSVSEEMESSGVYSDLDRKGDGVVSDEIDVEPKTMFIDEPASTQAEKQPLTSDSSSSDASRTSQYSPSLTETDENTARVSPEENFVSLNARVCPDIDTPTKSDALAEKVTTPSSVVASNTVPTALASPSVPVEGNPPPEIPDAPELPTGASGIATTLPDASPPSHLAHRASGPPEVPSQTLEAPNPMTPLPAKSIVKDPVPRKYKMPKRNVTSKIKTMLETSAQLNDDMSGIEESRRVRTPRRPGRWDAVLEKIAVGQAEQKLKPSRLKEVKSKVFADLTPVPTNLPPNVERSESRRNTSNVGNKSCSRRRSRVWSSNSSLHAGAMAEKGTSTPGRHASGQVPTSGAVSAAAATLTATTNSSVHSSLSDVSAGCAAGCTPCKSSPVIRASKKQRDSGRSANPLRDTRGHARSTTMRESAANTTPTRSTAGQACGSDMKTPTRKVSTRRNITGVSQKSMQQRDQYRRPANGVDAESNPLKQLAAEPKAPPTRAPAPAPAPVPPPALPALPAPPAPPATALSLYSCNDAALATPAVNAPPGRKDKHALSTLDSAAAPVPSGASATDRDARPLAALLQEPFRRFTLGFDALTIVLQHTLKKLETLEKCEKFKDYYNIKSELEYNKEEADEYKRTIGRLENALKEESNRCNLISSKQKELAVQNKKILEEKLNAEYEKSDIIAALEKKCQAQVELVHSQYSSEHAALQARFKEQEESLLRDFNEKHKTEQKEHELLVAQMRETFLQQETVLKSENSQLQEDHERLKKQLSIFVDAETKDGRLQASVARCMELEEEVRSLQSVLELRHQEFQELRKNNCSLTSQAEQLPGALQRVTALEARVEDLQAQLKEKNELERQTAQQQRALIEALQKEVNQKKRLTLLNEELQWKLKQNSEVFSALAAMNGTCNVQVPSSSGASSPAVTRKSASGSLHAISESTSPAKGDSDTISRISISLMKRINNSHQTRPDIDYISSSPPPSPKIKGIVEKSDSVSWVLDMEESSEELVSRLVRRAGSFRGPTPPPPSGQGNNTQTQHSNQRRIKSSTPLHSSSSPIHAKSSSSTDNSVTVPCTEHIQRCSEHLGSGRLRSHSVSDDTAASIEVLNWGVNLSDSYNKIPGNSHEGSSHERKLYHTVKNCENPNFHKIHNQLDLVLSNNLNTDFSYENATKNWNCNTMLDFSNDDSLSKSSSSSAYTSSDEEARNSRDSSKNISVDDNYCPSEKSTHLSNMLPLSALNICGSPNTADLSLLAACAAAQPAMMPKDAGGEAMVSEETTEDENDHEGEDNKDKNTIFSITTRGASENEDEDDVDDDDDEEEDDEEGVKGGMVVVEEDEEEEDVGQERQEIMMQENRRMKKR